MEFFAFTTVRSAYSCPPGNKGYFEVEILGLDVYPQYGFAASSFEAVRGSSGGGVGDDEYSWAVDGARQLRWHNGKSEYTCFWKEGDVVGMACDLDKRQVLVSVNGSFEPPNGLIFDLPPDAATDGLFAALSGQSGKVRWNLGDVPFKYAPPSEDFKGFVHFQFSGPGSS